MGAMGGLILLLPVARWRQRDEVHFCRSPSPPLWGSHGGKFAIGSMIEERVALLITHHLSLGSPLPHHTSS